MSADPAPHTPPAFPQAWHTVSFGVKCMSVGSELIVGALIVLSLLIACNAQLLSEPRLEGMEGRDREVPPISIVGCLLVFFTGALLWLGGLCMVCVAPAESGARPLAAGAAVCWLLFLIAALQVPTSAVGVRLRTPRLAEAGRRDGDPIRMVYGSDNGTALAAAMLAVAGASLALGAVCAIAHRFHNAGLASGARRLLVYQVIAPAALLFLFYLHHAVAETWRDLPWHAATLPFLLASFALAVTGCIWLRRVLAETRRMLGTAEEIAREAI